MKGLKRNVIKILVALVIYAAILAIGVSLLLHIAGLNDGLSGNKKSNISVVATTFPGYDFARAIVGTDNAKMLLKPGGEAHTYEPTPADIRAIQESDLFIYTGGDSDAWVENLLKTIDRKKTTIVKLMDLVKTKDEETVEGMENNDESSEPEADEHVWTSPKNAITIMQKLNAIVDKIDKSGKSKYDQNASKYEKEIAKTDEEFRKIVDSGKRREIVVGDRFPLRYFTDEYGLKYYAAFPGCSEQTEASSETIAFLTRKVKEDKIPVVLKMELSKGNIAETIADETGSKVLEFNSAHNISQKDFDAGATYVNIMKRNENIMREALN